MKRVKYTIPLLLTALTLVGCSSQGGGGLDIVQLVKNPVVGVIIGIIILWFVFKGSGSKGG